MFVPQVTNCIILAILNKGPRNRVQWNQAFLLVKSFKLVPRPLDKGPRSRQFTLWFSLHGIILKGKPIDLDQIFFKKESSSFWELECKLRSTVVHFFVFSSFSWVFKTQKWKTCYKLRTLLRTHKAPPILTNFGVDMVDFVHPHKVVAYRNAFSK
jgi:hypothetical protein